MDTIEIRTYKKTDKKNIDVMIREISNEFLLPIATENNSQKPILDGYWIAFYQNELIGTIGMLNIDKNVSVLKNMFVKKEFRGENHSTAKLLLNTAIQWSNDQSKSVIYLGTMNQFKAAQRFYEKNGFIKINKGQLPNNFIFNPIDDLFYKKELITYDE